MAICELCRKSSKHKELLMAEYWWKGCKWCRSSDDWPSDVKTKATSKTEKEEIITREVMTSTTQKSGIMEAKIGKATRTPKGHIVISSTI